MRRGSAGVAGLVAVLVAVLVAGLLGLSSPADAARATATTTATTVFAHVPAPGYPAYVFVSTGRRLGHRVYAGSYEAGETQALGGTGAGAPPSKVFAWSPSGRLLHTWTVPGQRLDQPHGVQVADQTRRGRLVVLETSTRSVLTLDTRTGRFRRVARFPAGVVPNYATWGPDGSLYVTDYGDGGGIWRVRHGQVTRWFTSPALTGVAGFGTTGLTYRPRRHDLLVAQSTVGDGSAAPTNGRLYRLPVRHGRPGRLQPLWTSRPTELPDGLGVARSGHVYLALSGLTQQVVELTASGHELRRFGTPLTGANGSSVPFDTPCSATFLGTSVLVANQSAVAGDAAHQAILRVRVGERGSPPYVPRRAGL